MQVFGTGVTTLNVKYHAKASLRKFGLVKFTVRIARYSTGTENDIEIQLLRLVQLALAGAEIVTQRSEEIRHQGSGLMSIGGIRLAEL